MVHLSLGQQLFKLLRANWRLLQRCVDHGRPTEVVKLAAVGEHGLVEGAALGSVGKVRDERCLRGVQGYTRSV